jgi:hypothetical protein
LLFLAAGTWSLCRFFGDLIGGQVMLLVVLFPIRLIVAELTCRCWFWQHYRMILGIRDGGQAPILQPVKRHRHGGRASYIFGAAPTAQPAIT